MEKKKKIILILAAVLFVLGIGFGLLIGLKNRTYKIAIYGLPKKVSQSLKLQIESFGGKFAVSVLDEEDGFSVDQSKKYDLIFTWNGAFAEALAKSAVDIPGGAYSKMPISVRRSGVVDGKNRMLPILYDHVPLFFCKSASTYNDYSGPETIAALEENMETERGNFTFAMLTAGSDDEYFYGFISMAIESVIGGEGYKNLVADIAEKKNFRDVLDDVVGKSADGEDLTLRTAFNKIFEWQNKGLLQRQWYSIGQTDVFNLMQYESFYIGAMPLEYYRTMPRMVSNNYTAFRFPMESLDMDHGLIASEVVLIPHSKKKIVRKLEDHLVSLDIQEQLSNATTFSPVHSQSGAYDIVADDARFYAASTKCGPLPMLDRAAFTSKELAEKFAQDAREFFLVGN